MNQYTTESALMDSYLFKSFNTGSLITQRVIEALKEGIILDKSYIEEQLFQIRRLRISVLTDKIIKAMETNELMLVYAKTTTIPSAIPFITSLNKFNKPIVYVFVNNYGYSTILSKDGGEPHLICNVKDLYALMEAAYIALEYAKNPTSVTKKLGLTKTSVMIYSALLMNIFNKEYSLSMDPVLYDKVSFCLSKFFLEKVWGMENKDVIISYSKLHNTTSRGMSSTEADMLVDEYEQANIDNFDDLIKFIQELNPRLKSLTIKYFMDAYIRMYKAPSIFGLEVLPYFFFIVTSSLIGSYICRADIITDIAKRVPGINKFYSELTNSLK